MGADVEFSAEDATRTELDFLVDVFTAAIENGATTINVPDTVGFVLPQEYVDILDALRAKIPGSDQVTWSVHCHNDLGLATANSLAAVRAGVRQVEVCINGIGERAGNAALEEVVMALRTHHPSLGLETGINTREIASTSRLVSLLSGYPVQPNKAVIGGNAFSHESGIHQHGVLMERTTYEIMNPEDIGLSGNKIVLGKHSGRHAFVSALEGLGIHLKDEQLEHAFGRFKEHGRPQGVPHRRRPGRARHRRRRGRHHHRAPGRSSGSLWPAAPTSSRVRPYGWRAGTRSARPTRPATA